MSCILALAPNQVYKYTYTSSHILNIHVKKYPTHSQYMYKHIPILYNIPYTYIYLCRYHYTSSIKKYHIKMSVFYNLNYHC